MRTTSNRLMLSFVALQPTSAQRLIRSLSRSHVEQPGTLRHKSKIKADTIASLEQSILIKQIARLKLPVFRRVIAEIEDLIRSP